MSGFSIPLLIGRGGASINNLVPVVLTGSASIGGTLSLIVVPLGTPAGTASVSAAITLAGTPLLSADSPAGQTVVSAFLQNGLLDGIGAFITELAGTIAGTTSVTNTGLLKYDPADPTNQERFLYLYLSVGVGFDPIDSYAGGGTLVSQSFPDGDAVGFERWLYQYLNVGVGFDPTDTYGGVGTIISQSFPDGHVRDFARWLFQYVMPIKSSRSFGQLIIKPGWSPRTNPAVPPSNRHA